MSSKTMRSGSIMVMALFFTAILAAAGAITFGVIQNRYRQVHQTASWQEALLAAEAGIDIAVNEMRKQLFDPDKAWKDWGKTEGAEGEEPAGDSSPIEGEVFYTSKVLLRQGEGGQRSYSKIVVDAPSFLIDKSGEQWYRVRSMGVAEVPGGAVVAGDKVDLRLRKFEHRFDRRTGAALSKSQATRLIEAIVKPVGTFRVALFGAKTINLNNHNIVVDSYDSRDPDKSTPDGSYDPAKRTENGDIATNGQLLQAGDAHIYGDASTNGGTVLETSNVTGEIRDDFYQELFAVNRPNVIRDPYTVTTVNGTEILDAKAGAPSQYVLDQISLSGQNTLRIRGIAGQSTYAQIVVNGDISTSGQAEIILDPGVHLRIFVAGNVDITGSGLSNPNSPLHFQLYGLDRPTNADGSPQSPGTMKISGNGGFRGTVYAPMYDVEMVGGGTTDPEKSIYGALVGWTVRMTGVQAVHYDEALTDSGLISDYKVVSWFEDAR